MSTGNLCAKTVLLRIGIVLSTLDGALPKSVVTSFETDAFTAITELSIYTPDHPRLLALITGACAAAGANIAGAQIFTTTDGMALDTILIHRGRG